MEDKRVILEKNKIEWTIDRICHQLMEQFDDFSDVCLVGIQPRGTLFSDILYQRLGELTDVSKLKYGQLDITFFRDDFRRSERPLIPYSNQLEFLVENQSVVLVDDVLYTGRTIQAALMALNQYGRPGRVELLVLVDRRFNRHLPIQPDIVGITVDALDRAHVKVDWESRQVFMYSDKYPTK
jgi:pyrimidine operon attenuation protein / uracil phosphoribosyltransferase